MTTLATKPRSTAPVEGAPAAGAEFPLAAKALERVNVPRHPEMPSEFDGRWKLAQVFADAGIVPPGYADKENGPINVAKVFVALQYAAELGLSPFIGIQNIAIIHNRPFLEVEARYALAMSVGVIEDHWTESTGSIEGQNLIVKAFVKRRGWPRVFEGSFSYADARTGQLIGKKGPWQTYPRDMVEYRARGRAVNLAAPELFAGLPTTREDAEDEAAPTPAPRPAFKMTAEELNHLRTIVEVHKIPMDVQKQIRVEVTGGREVEFDPPGDKTKGIPQFTEAEYKELRTRLKAYKAGVAQPAAPRPAAPAATTEGPAPVAAPPPQQQAAPNPHWAAVVALGEKHGVQLDYLKGIVKASTGKTLPQELTAEDVSKVEVALEAMASGDGPPA